jgi:hypothetical protein
MLTQNERPYINEQRPELRKIFQENKDNLDVLLNIKIELQFRSKRKPVLNLAAQIEQRLKELESFQWVSTEAKIGNGKLDIINWNKTGLLSAVGYETGVNGLDEKSRRNILDSVYFCEIPKNLKLADLNSWGKPETCARLKKLVDCLASFTRNEKRNYTGDYSISISERETDLKYLKRKYYDGKYDFGFPKTDV